VSSVPAFVEVVTAALRQEDPGLLDVTKYVAQAPKSISAALLDRMIFENGSYQIVSIDSIGLPGISKIQLSIDLRS
jgi:hypothetical protein